MRRFTLTIATSITALALLPAGALARDHVEHHQRQHERRHHHVHHASVRHERFGAVTTAATAATVQSFSDGVLTLALGDGSTASGRVDTGTEVECEMSEVNDMRADGDGGSGNGRGDNSGGDSSGDHRDRGGDNGNDNADRGDDNGNDNQNCQAADLVTGAVLRSAELRISSAGATWDKIELAG